MHPMDVPITRLDPTIPLPTYKTPGAAAFDLAPSTDVVINPGAVAYVPTGLVIAVPKQHTLILAPRSSLHTLGLVLANQIGVIDEDFCGPEDELKIALRNITEHPVTIQRGQRICQGILLSIARAEWVEQSARDTAAISRGGFGSTGNFS